jgi:hypothetical protein
MSSQINAGKAVVAIEANRSRLAQGLAAAQKQLNTFAAGAAKIGGGALVGAGAVLAPISASVKAFADAGGALDDMAQRTGASVEALSGLGYAAKMSGSSIEDVEKGIRTMQKGLIAGDESFAGLGLSIEALRSMSPDEQFKAIADKLASIDDPAERASKAMEIFGKSGADLVPLLSGGAKGIEALTSEAAKNGAVMSGEQAEAAAKLGDAIDMVGVSFGGLVNTIGAQVAPLFTTLLQIVTQSINSAREWIAANQGVVLAITLTAAVIGLFGAGLITAAGLAYALSVAIGAVGAVASAVSMILGAIASIFTGGIVVAIGLVIAALAGLAAYLIYASGAGGKALDWLGSKFKMLQDIAGPVFKGIQDAMSGGDLGLAAEIAWNGIQLAWLKGTADLRAGWDTWLNGLLGALDGFITSFRKKWNDVSGWFADRMLDTMGAIDSSFDAEGAKQMRAEDTARQNKSFDSGVASRAAERDAAAKASIEKREAAIKELDGKLAESVARAAAAAAANADKTETQSLVIDDFDENLKKKKDDTEEVATSSVDKGSRDVGTFSGFAAAMLGQGGRSVDLDILAESKTQSTLLGKVLAELQNQKGATFA